MAGFETNFSDVNGHNLSTVLRTLNPPSVHRRWLSDAHVVKCLAQHHGYAALKWCDPKLRGVGPIVLAAVRQNGLALRLADGELKKDREIVLAAVKQSGYALLYADGEPGRDREIGTASIARTMSA